jgi:MFS family permease
VDDVIPVAGAGRYRALFATPHARRLTATALVARMPMGMVPLALLLVVRDGGGSYGSAGLVSGAFLVAAGIGAPVAGRLMDRREASRILLRRAVLSPLALLAAGALAVASAPLAAVGVCAAAAGALLPPVGSALRALWPRLLQGPTLRSTAYSLEASLQEIFFVIGPLLVALAAGLLAPVVALVIAAAACAGGTVAFAVTPPVRAWRPDGTPADAGRIGALGAGGVRTIVLFGSCCGLAFGGAEVGMPAFAEEHGSAALGGIPLALFAAGSLVGGLVVGARSTREPRSLLRVASVLLAIGLAPLVLAPSLPVLAVLAFVAGLPIAPSFAAAYGLIDRAARPGTNAEAFAWIGTALSAGLAAGAAVGGMAIDEWGVDAAFALGCGGAALSAVVARFGPGLSADG